MPSTISPPGASPLRIITTLLIPEALGPLILGYTAWAYWVFRGKVKVGSGYL